MTSRLDKIAQRVRISVPALEVSIETVIGVKPSKDNPNDYFWIETKESKKRDEYRVIPKSKTEMVESLVAGSRILVIGTTGDFIYGPLDERYMHSLYG